MKKTTEKAFTLIELLAVIVILAIIALIAVPVILNIIDKANKSAFKDSAYGVLNAAEYYYAASQLDLEGPMGTVDMPTTDSRLELKGSIPNGHVWITRDGEIAFYVYNERYCVTKGYDDEDITITEEFETCELPIDEDTGENQGTGGSTSNTLATLATTSTEVTSVPACVTDGSECAVGTAVAIKVNETETYNFYVLSETNNEVTLIMDRNLGDNVAWITGTDYSTENTDGTGCSKTSCNDEGPVTALNALNERTAGWTNIPETTYTVSGLGISYDGNTKTQLYEDMTVTGRARMLTYEEAKAVRCTTSSPSCPDWLYKNLYSTGDSTPDRNGYYKYGYWTTTPVAGGAGSTWRVGSGGGVDYTDVYSAYYGLRPVIEISK